MRGEPNRLTALVTGANRGLGLETCRQLAAKGLAVVVTARDAGRGERATRVLRRAGADARFERLDVADPASIGACLGRLRAARVRVDVLVNNAGVYPSGSALTAPIARWREAVDTHVFGPLLLAQGLMPAMNRRGYGRIVNVTSGYGSFAEDLEGPAAYCVSKAALDALTVKLAQEARRGVKVNAVCPGWVRTRMGGPGATVPVEDGADTIVWLATLPANGPNGALFRERRRIPW